jgi:hypothetical protein
MFGWLFTPPTCPVEEQTRLWFDERFAWLLGAFGTETIRAAPAILPTAEFFPEPYRDMMADAGVFFPRVCRYMNLDPAAGTLTFYHDDGAAAGLTDWAAGRYVLEPDGRFTVRVDVGLLVDPVGLVATLARRLAQIHLLGFSHPALLDEDREPLADLLTVFLGLGVVTANAALYESSHPGLIYTHRVVGRRGALTMPMYGYALALFARVRGEKNPRWARYLRPDVRKAFYQSQGYLAAHPPGFPAVVPARIPRTNPAPAAEGPTTTPGTDLTSPGAHSIQRPDVPAVVLSRTTPTPVAQQPARTEQHRETRRAGTSNCRACPGTIDLIADKEGAETGYCRKCRESIAQMTEDSDDADAAADQLGQRILSGGCFWILVVLTVVLVLNALGPLR